MTSMQIDFNDLESREVDLATSSAHPETAKILSELDRKKLARKIALPTNDGEVRARLRELGEPITLFGEGPADRRDRLRDILAKARLEKGEQMDVDEESEEESDESDEEDKEEEFYTEGSAALKKARRDIAEYSLPRARKRIARQRLDASVTLARLMDVRKAVFSNLESFTNLGSQIGDTRALSAVRFSPDSSMLLTGSWTGMAKLWSVPACKEIRTLKGHKERIGGVAWHPEATLSQSKSAVNFATSGADHDIKLWGLENDTALQTLSGHEGRVCRINFHPSGRYLGSASYDGTWRLWDVERGDELLLQEGHSKEVYAVAFQQDGALACTGGLDAIARLWDLRSGRTALVLSGHSRDILAIDFSSNGYQIATGSNDDTIRIWDLRNHQAIATIPAHKSAVSDLKFFQASPSASYPTTAVPRAFSGLPIFQGETTDPDASGDTAEEANREDKPDFPVSGSFLVSSGYDGYVKIWSADDWQQVRALSNDQSGKVMSVDVSSDARFIVSGQYDRSYKLWATPDVDLAA
ncbi:SPOSA6832_01870, partial [Sporobolomyces salmonicolor]